MWPEPMVIKGKWVFYAWYESCVQDAVQARGEGGGGKGGPGPLQIGWKL